MKSYLDLIPISARVHRRQNRMTLLCIIFAVFMVTAVFSMADMGVRMELSRLADKHNALTLQEIGSTAMGQTLFVTAAVLFMLILAAGVLMISSSINSSVAQRTRFFGMMRCIGMSRQQIIRFVRLEALNWCRMAIPIGLVLGSRGFMGCCARRFVSWWERNFPEFLFFEFSAIGIISGIAVGIISVLLAAGAPARRAAKVPPAAAVSGNSENGNAGQSPVHARFVKIETAMGIHHAVSTGKNLVLMTG